MNQSVRKRRGSGRITLHDVAELDLPQPTDEVSNGKTGILSARCINGWNLSTRGLRRPRSGTRVVRRRG
jgi:hypothetical protein